MVAFQATYPQITYIFQYQQVKLMGQRLLDQQQLVHEISIPAGQIDGKLMAYTWSELEDFNTSRSN